jgi:hypothetical protein
VDRGERAKTTPPPEPLANKQTEPLPPPPPAEEAPMDAMRRFELAICACTDSECVKNVSNDMTKWSQDYAAKHKEPEKMSEADQKRATEIGMHMGECMQKAMSQQP